MQLTDTNVISELMLRQPAESVLNWMRQIETSNGRLSISVVSIEEISYGLQRRPNAAKSAWFDLFVQRNLVLDVTQTIARRAGEMRALQSLRGQVRSQPDMLIAATAQVRALTLVTRNVRDFEGCGIGILNPFDN